MQKRTLLTISIFTAVLLLLIITGIKPFNFVITMAQQYVDSYNRGNSGPDNKEVEKTTDNEPSNNDQINTNKEPIKSEEPENDPSDSHDAQNSQDTQDSPLAFENTTLIDENGRQIVTNVDSILVLVNKNRNLPADYVPENMVIPNVKFSFEGDSLKKYLRKEAALALEELFQAAKNENMELMAASGYRSFQRQKSIFDNKVKAIGEEAANMISAYPGQSEHQTGLAMDITCPEASLSLSENFGETNEGIWVKENAHKYGFIIRYPKGKEKITGYNYEPWHLRYVGKEAASYIYENGLTLEEYFAQLYNY
ncbi:MAG: M15 family metallopeptidase [Dehalobacterium sp.]